MSSFGQQLLSVRIYAAFRGIEIIENYRPDWLEGLELDFWIPLHSIAFEFQGDQHFAPVFGSEAFNKQILNDKKKRALCRFKGVVLVKIEAWELQKIRFDSKLMAALNWYRPMEKNGDRKRWLRSLNLAKSHDWNLPAGFGKDKAIEYCRTITATLGSFSAIPRKNHRQREALKSRFFRAY